MVATVERYERDLEQLAPAGGLSDFVMIERPVFKEHVNRDGDKIDEKALRRICRNCNSRIRDTGDFAPLVVGHTDDEGRNDPEVIGFVGPFRMGRIGRVKSVAAIYAKQWVRREHAEKLKKYPRLSVEYWADKDDPANGHFDPVSLLGAETPELDLGIHYQRNREGKTIMRYQRAIRYQAATPGGAPNTCLPGMVSGKKKKNDYAKEPGSMTPEDLNQLIEAMQPIIKQMVSEAMNPVPLEGEPETTPPPVDDAMPDEGMPPAGDPMADAPPAGPEMDMGDVPDEVADDEDEPEKYEADGMAKMYRRERDNYRAKYSKELTARRAAESRLQELESEIGEFRAEKQRVERYSKLKELRDEGFMIEPDEELAEVADLSDNQFAKHCERIQAKYQRVPMGRQIPTERAKKYTGHSDDERRERYAKVATEETQKLRSQGGKFKKITYAEVLDNVTKNDGKYVPA